jgi:hypothetical protein
MTVTTSQRLLADRPEATRRLAPGAWRLHRLVRYAAASSLRWTAAVPIQDSLLEISSDQWMIG